MIYYVSQKNTAAGDGTKEDPLKKRLDAYVRGVFAPCRIPRSAKVRLI